MTDIWRTCLSGARACLAHVPVWRTCLSGARDCLAHVTGAVAHRPRSPAAWASASTCAPVGAAVQERSRAPLTGRRALGPIMAGACRRCQQNRLFAPRYVPQGISRAILPTDVASRRRRAVTYDGTGGRRWPTFIPNGCREVTPALSCAPECLAGKTGPRGGDFNMRWIASVVAETYRILTCGVSSSIRRTQQGASRAGVAPAHVRVQSDLLHRRAGWRWRQHRMRARYGTPAFEPPPARADDPRIQERGRADRALPPRTCCWAEVSIRRLALQQPFRPWCPESTSSIV